MKYIVGDLGSAQLTTALVFHEGIEHRTFENCFRAGSIVSAGFCKISVIKGEVIVTAYGESVGLGVSSNPEKDAKIIKRAIEINMVN